MSEWDVTVERLVRDRGTALLRYGFLLCGQRAEAEDLVQEALIRMCTRAPRSMDAAMAEAYVRRSMLNGYIDGFRRRQRWARIRHLLAADIVADGPEDRVGDILQIESALAALPARQRACVVLRFHEDLTVPAIADLLGVGVGTVKRYLSEALATMSSTVGVEFAEDAEPDTTGTELTIIDGRSS